MLSSLAGFQHLKSLVSLNLNFNALTSLEGIGSCTALQHLFVANNRIRDVGPLVSCEHLQTVHLFRNNISNLDLTIGVLSNLPKLKELELAGNPCSMAPEYKHRAVLQLDLESLDGDQINQLDFDLANEYFAANGGVPPGVGPRVDILTLEDVDAAGGAAQASGGGTGPSVSIPEAASISGEPSAVDAAGATGAAGGSQHNSASGGLGPVPEGAPAAAAGGSGRAGPPPATAWVPLPRPGTAAGRNIPAGPSGGPLLPRPGTAALLRPGSASANGGPARPGSAYSGAGVSVQLVSNEILNDHPLILEYLAKHVLMEGLALAEAANGGSVGSASGSGTGSAGRPGSGSGEGGRAGRGPSFAQRLRDTAAAMNACEDVDAKTLAGSGAELIATPQTVRRGMAEEMVAAAGPHELTRQLVRLCEVLIKEVEASRAGRPHSANAALGRPGTAAGARPMTAAAGGASASSEPVVVSTPATAAEGELAAARAEVARLCRENKALRLENENMYWLAEEVKRLKAELDKERAAVGAKAAGGR
ncbi:hypothetical protein HYH02_014063 [Chlamydomonas schloesseri]|uniref:Flagellar associated protein n=1 Tax=Chlamydomonas schloesseri TaxID=2026947 RepID=A0A835STH7_9CHLO|nr:hypothetical protein HYH02_014063 [Chlamydomonas schloesseri]|eukprot:KAG2429408.1 hypothetical protein HYH02_014063 [Chlamydomonas schloesseri]